MSAETLAAFVETSAAPGRSPDDPAVELPDEAIASVDVQWTGIDT